MATGGGLGERRRRAERSRRAVAAAVAVAREHGLRVAEPAVLNDLFSLRVHLRPAPVATGDVVPPTEAPPGVRLLSYFDAYAVGCYPRKLVFPGRAGERALARGQAGNDQNARRTRPRRVDFGGPRSTYE